MIWIMTGISKESKNGRETFIIQMYNKIKAMFHPFYTHKLRMDSMEYTEMVRRTIAYIEKNLENKITLDDLANNTYISKYHFHRIFHEATGMGIMEYIRQRRLECAAGQLLETSGGIADIAMQYQFETQDGFSRAFKKYYGTTPGQYRKYNRRFNT